MPPVPQIQTSQHFEWDTPWSTEFLAISCVLFLAWTVWNLVREGYAAKLYWWIVFLITRTAVAGILLWMILGPTSVLTRTEIHPRTLSVYLDSSSSMLIQDQPDPVSDLRWEIAADYQPHSLAAADRAVFFASALRQQTQRISSAIEQQADSEERREIATKWIQLSDKCREWLDSDILNHSLSNLQKELRNELHQTLRNDLRPFLEETTWITGNDPGDRDQRLQRLTEFGDQFVVRCRIFAEEIASGSIPANNSNAKANVTEPPTRLQHAMPAIQNSLTEWLKPGKDVYHVRMSQFSEAVASLPSENWQSQVNGNEETANPTQPIRRTNLTDLLKQIRNDATKDDLAAAVILTDGRHTSESAEDPRDVVSQLRVPIYLVPIGHGEMKRDLILRQVHAPNSVIQNDKILIEGIVTAHRFAGESCEVRLFENKKVVDSVRVNFRADQDDQRFRFEIPTDKIGRREFKIEIDRAADEHSADNNFAFAGVDVTDAIVRILLADGRARWEHQYLVNLFNRQDTIELDQLKLTPSPVGTGRLKKKPRFPETVEEWAEYRLVILGDVSPKLLNQKSQQSLYEYVTYRGGCLILIAGQNDMPHAFAQETLEQLLPVVHNPAFSLDKQGYRVEMTSEGKTSDVMQFADDLASTEQIWRETSASLPIYALSTYNKPKPNSQVFLSAVPLKAAASTVDSPAFLCWQTVGAGRVAFFSSPSSYQLRNRNGDKYHHRFWGQLVRWIITRSALAGSKCVKLLADKTHYSLSDTAQLSVELSEPTGRPVSDAAPEIEVTNRGQVVASVKLTPDQKVPGRYTGPFTPTADGKYSLKARGADVDKLLKEEKYSDPVQILVEFEPGLDRELADPRNDRPLLEYLAEQSGGAVLEPTALAELHQAVSLQPRKIEMSQMTTLWDRWWCLWVILGCLTVEWLIRKRVGLA